MSDDPIPKKWDNIPEKPEDLGFDCNEIILRFFIRLEQSSINIHRVVIEYFDKLDKITKKSGYTSDGSLDGESQMANHYAIGRNYRNYANELHDFAIQFRDRQISF